LLRKKKKKEKKNHKCTKCDKLKLIKTNAVHFTAAERKAAVGLGLDHQLSSQRMSRIIGGKQQQFNAPEKVAEI
jgi:hypothetical protein